MRNRGDQVPVKSHKHGNVLLLLLALAWGLLVMYFWFDLERAEEK